MTRMRMAGDRVMATAQDMETANRASRQVTTQGGAEGHRGNQPGAQYRGAASDGTVS